jgi:hypothetical protein
MAASDREDVTHEAIRDAWDFWLSQHDVSVPLIIEQAIKSAVMTWLEEHTDELLNRVATEIVEEIKRSFTTRR